MTRLKRIALVLVISITALTAVAQTQLPANATLTKEKMLQVIKTAVSNLDLLEQVQNQLFAFMPEEERLAMESQQRAEQQQAASCMGISVEKLIETENSIKSDKQKMLSSVDQCAIHLPETINLGSSNADDILPFSECMYALGAKELGVSVSKAQQCGYGEKLVDRYQFQ